MWLKDGLKGADILEDPRLESYLLNYFPQRLQREFSEQIIKHPLRNEIIANEIVSEGTLAVGISFLPTLVSSTGATIPQVMASLIAADTIFDTRELRLRLRQLDTVENCSCFLDAWLDLTTAIQRATKWLVQTHARGSSIGELVQIYGSGFSRLVPHARSMFAADELERFEVRLTEYTQRGVTNEDCIVLSLLRRVHLVLEILWCSREFNLDVKDVALTLSTTFELLNLGSLFKHEQTLQTTNRWEQELAEGAYQDIRRELAKITGQLLAIKSNPSTEDVRNILSSSLSYTAISSTVSEINDGLRNKRGFSISVLPLIARHLRELSANLVEFSRNP
jgi:glutamate dehydrogenase